MTFRPDEPLVGARYEVIDGRWTCVEVTLARPGAEITTAWVRSLPIATLIDRHRRDVMLPALGEFESG